jgi:hypothetical protein
VDDVDPAVSARNRLDGARRGIAEAQVAVDTVDELARTLPRSLHAMLFAFANLLGAARDGLGRGDAADRALEHMFAATNALNDAAQRGRWRRRQAAEDLRSCLTELVNAAAIVSSLLSDIRPHSSEQTEQALKTAPIITAVIRDALSVRRPGSSADDVLTAVSLNLRLLIDTADGLRRGLEAAMIRWDEPHQSVP